MSVSGRWHDWINFFLTGIAEQARDAGDRAKTLQDLQASWRTQLQASHSTGLTLAVADYLFERPVLGASSVQQRFRVSHPTALKTLRRLEAIAIIEPTRAGKEYLFFCDPILKLI